MYFDTHVHLNDEVYENYDEIIKEIDIYKEHLEPAWEYPNPDDQWIFAETVSRVAALCQAAPEIAEMDINPLLGNSTSLTAVDARIRIAREIL